MSVFFWPIISIQDGDLPYQLALKLNHYGSADAAKNLFNAYPHKTLPTLPKKPSRPQLPPIHLIRPTKPLSTTSVKGSQPTSYIRPQPPGVEKVASDSVKSSAIRGSVVPPRIFSQESKPDIRQHHQPIDQNASVPRASAEQEQRAPVEQEQRAPAEQQQRASAEQQQLAPPDQGQKPSLQGAQNGEGQSARLAWYRPVFQMDRDFHASACGAGQSLIVFLLAFGHFFF